MARPFLPRMAVASLVFATASVLIGASVRAAALPMVGAWMLKLDDGSRQCRVTLRAEAVRSGRAIGMPAGCHHAFPALIGIASWTDAGDGRLVLETEAGEPVITFEPGQGGALTGAGAQGSVYRLEPVGDHQAVVTKVASKSGKTAPAASDADAPQRSAPKTSDVAGRYAVLRAKSGDTGCMVTLDEKARGPGGTLKANLAPACRDQGIVIFDPVGWTLKGGRLVLTARKGHTTELDLQDDGTWLKDPKQGKSLGLKRL